MFSKVKGTFHLPGVGTGSEEWALGFNEHGVSVWNEEVQGVDDGDGCATTEAHVLPLNCTLENTAKSACFRLSILYHSEKKSSDTSFKLESSHDILIAEEVNYTANTE